ncbi:MAG TPA: sulfotransferase [Sphingobium sp.]|uniref:sulfotransferase family protein n=1 Tax=Sphingobium sp. TaxID=1912891 RepID=UPI002ED55FE8
MIDISKLTRTATENTGLSNFGEDTWQEGLEVLAKSVSEEAELNAAGRASFDRTVVSLLSRRLEVEDWHARHPEIDEENLEAPLIVLGLPRTGSTALHNLLAQDPKVRVLRNWESTFPCPPPETATQFSDPRIALVEHQLALGDKAMPRMKQMLPMTATSPIEDQFIMGHDFKSQVFMPMFRIPSYVKWFNEEADLVATFRYVKRVLKLLQWRCPPKKWRLKNPSYSQCIAELDTVFPDALYCMTHRPVEEVIPSMADLYREIASVNTNSVDPVWLGEVATNNCEDGMRRMISFRAVGNESRFFDIHFRALQAEPLTVIEELYDFLGENLTADAKAAMLSWREDTPRDKHGRHEYHAADFGLDRETLRNRFAFYSDKFEVPRV